MTWRLRLAPSLLAVAALTSCGAKTGLLVPDAAVVPRDAGTDAFVALDGGLDGGFDAGLDAACPATPLRFERTEVATLFLMDGSGSMGLTWDGLPFGAGLPSRWMIVRDTLARVLPPFDRQLALGAKVFPDGPMCGIGGGLDVLPTTGATAPILALFDRWIPEGGTPTAEALRLTLAAIDPGDDRPTVIVVTMDGGPNCNDDTGVAGDVCTCTGPRSSCLRPAPEGQQSCLDDVRTLEVVREAAEVRHTPVLVVGIDDPTRPDLSDFLDEMAVAGSLPRPAGEGRRFYSALEPDDLETAFTEITERIAQCVLAGTFVAGVDSDVEVSLGGEPLLRDPTHEEGWDWTDPERGVITLFGSACDRLRTEDPPVTGVLHCAR